MNNYCVLIPHIKTQDGKYEESKLFKDLLSLTSNQREKAVRAYSTLISEDFKEEYADSIEFDNLGEPVLSSALSIGKIKAIIDTDVAIAGLTKSLGGIDKNGTVHLADTTQNYQSLSKKITDFNTNSTFSKDFVALIKRDEQGLFISVEPRTGENTVEAKQIATNLSLNRRIRTILANSGIATGTLDALQERVKASGVVDYKNAETTAEGLIQLIKLAEGIEGEKALPEEFAHLALDILGDDPMVERLMSILNKDEVLQQVLGDEYQTYIEQYGEDVERLKREAAGKLVYKSWFQGNNPIPGYSSFVSRMIEAIKAAIRKVFNRDSINSAIAEAQDAASLIGTKLLSSPRLENMQLEELKKLPSLYHLENGAKTKKEILEKSISNSLKKYIFYTESLNTKIKAEKDPVKREMLEKQLESYTTRMTEFINEQKERFDEEQYDEGIQNFIMDASREIEGTKKRLANLIGGGLSLEERAYTLRNLSNIINSIEGTAKDIQASLRYEDTDLVLTQGTREALDQLVSALEGVKSQFNIEAHKTFGNYLRRFFPKEGIEVTSRGETKKITQNDILELLKTADQDIGIMDTFVQSAANSNDIIIQLADKAMKASKDRKRQRVEEVKQELLRAAKELKDANDSDEIVFEKHADGTLSGRYKSTTNWTLYFDNKAEFERILKEKYGERPRGANGRLYMKELRQWRKENETAFGLPNSKYDTDPTAGMTEAQRNYYNTLMKVREEMLSYLPMKTLEGDPMKAVQITKELWERLKGSSVDTWGKQVMKAIKDSFVVKVDDTNFGFKRAVKGFNDEEIMSVPIFFVNNVPESSLSRDTASTMIAFADMAINYDEMSKVTDLFEIGRGVMENRKSNVVRAGHTLRETISALGIKAGQTITKSSNNNFVERYNEFLRTQLYGRYMRDDGFDLNDGEKISSGKAATVLNRISSLNQLAVNLLAGIAAVGSDIINVNSEVLAGSIRNGKAFFSAKNLWDADKIYRKDIIKVLGEFGNPIKTSKLGLFIEKFDILHEYENQINNIEWKKGKAKKLLSENSLYFFMQAGAHWGETRTALAQAQAIKIKSDDGTREESLWDILEIKYLDENDHSKGASLVAKDGFTLSDTQITMYTRKFAGLNQRLYGIYSKSDTNALQTTAIGQLIFLYRKFIIPSINRRYAGLFSQKSSYNFDLDTETEGYYTSAFHFLRNLAKDSKHLGRNISLYWNDMKDFERSNCMRALNEMGTFIILLSLSSVLKGLDWDDSDNPWAKRFLVYMSRRLKTETGAFSPVGVTGELWNIVKSPMAAVNTLESLGDITEALLPWSWFGEDAIVQSGRYKGKTKGYKAIMQSPFVPMNKTIYRAFHPETGLVAFQ